MDMTLVAHLPAKDLMTLLEVIQQSFTVRRHYELFSWLQNDLQQFIPHDIMIAAWGDLSLGLISYDIISPLPGIRTEGFDDKTLLPLVSALFSRWITCDQEPFVVNTESGFSHANIDCPIIASAMGRMRCGLVHGIKDQRGRHDCIYVLLGPRELGDLRSKLSLHFLLPYIDTTLRQIAHLPEQYATDPVDASEIVRENPFGMSDREMEIMNWVGFGKTNQEIGLILDISSFTVKNHLQRIFRKINVINRAQAVAKMESV